jgi:hypothetical protein
MSRIMERTGGVPPESKLPPCILAGMPGESPTISLLPDILCIFSRKGSLDQAVFPGPAAGTGIQLRHHHQVRRISDIRIQ